MHLQVPRSSVAEILLVMGAPCLHRRASGIYIPFSHPRMAGSSDRYSVSSRTWPSFRSSSVGAGFVFTEKVWPGMILSLGRSARTMDW